MDTLGDLKTYQHVLDYFLPTISLQNQMQLSVIARKLRLGGA